MHDHTLDEAREQQLRAAQWTHRRSDMKPCPCSYIADTSGESEDAPVKRGLPLGADSSGNLYFHLGSDLGKVSVFRALELFLWGWRMDALVAGVTGQYGDLAHALSLSHNLARSPFNWQTDAVHSSPGGAGGVQ